MVLCAATGCTTYQYETEPRAPDPLPVDTPGSYTEGDDPCATDPSACEDMSVLREAQEMPEQIYAAQQLSGPLAGAPAVRRSASFASVTTPPPPQAPEPLETQRPTKEMIDIEARIELEVPRVGAAVEKIRKFVKAARGSIVGEVQEDSSSTSGAALSVRVPTARVPHLLASLTTVGKLRSRKVEMKEMGRRYGDAQTLVRNLETTLERYEKLLEAAQDVDDMVTIEGALSRIRTRIERVEGDLAWMRDRTSRSTVYIRIASEAEGQNVAPQKKLQLGARGLTAFDFSAPGGTESFGGAGLALIFSRGISLDADFAGKLDGGGSGVDFFLTTFGGELYSELFGHGNRRYLNPFIGLRLGYARNLGADEMALGATLGIELLRAEVLTLEAQSRIYAFVGTEERGAHAVIEPALVASVAY